ncbi:GumC family protein [Gloeocapsopsis dulcis]|uniref:non-specific protein-tyrosine kinase n=1 Tax=Gloeocapsopsis dulcis AAB1 = 1H9 TaxID=1433147 RepID=A0A6N8FVX6_9CHRO|nr:polysaccharide biosynthesis tyrosine autokinase [Gloeocapsopsis dulcis]MUL37278.1 protein tyrosine kinase [Gloeocapsopsis dulcis AAB1 = 1H9]WNN91082.1 polysaccharide biosynthesis tyrosine autokinase [Gloeocapsopsis dulcis]
MEEQLKQIGKNGNGKHPQPLLPIINTPFPILDTTDEWDLRQLLALIRRRALVLGSVAIALSASVGFWTFTRQPKYEGGFQLLVEPVTAESKLDGLTQIPGVNTVVQKEGLDYDTQIQVLRSPELMAPLIQEIATRYPNTNYASLLDNLRINRFQETKILDVRYQDSDPQKIEYILQQLAAGFLRYSLQERQTNLRQGIQFVDDQMPQLQERVNSLQRQLQQFRQEYNFIDPEVKAEQLSQQVSTIKLQRLETQKALAETRALYAALQSRAGAQLAESAALYTNLQDQSEASQALNSSTVYQNLVGQLREVDSQIAAESTRFQEDSPALLTLRQKRANLLPVLRQEAKRVLSNKLVEVSNQISGLEVRAAQIAQADNNLNQQIQQLPTLARQYTDLQRELKVATESLNRFLEKRESLQIETAQKEIPWQTIAAPQLTQEDPISPNIKRNLILGTVAGLLAGMGAALLAERLDNVFHSPDDLKEVTKLPLLGTIPFRKSLTQVAPAAELEVIKKPEGIQLLLDSFSNTQNESYFPFLEAFRSLHTNINFLGSDTPIHSLVISSASHADGKSTVAVHLAQAAAALGQRVLLVDTDLRLPQLHNKLSLANETGLSNVITTNLPVDDAIVRSPLWENLYVLTSGPIPPDPVKLLSSAKMQQIMAQLRQKFDLVIYDTPPMVGLADSSIIAPHTAGLILVVRMGKTDRSLLAQALDRLKMSPATVLGTVCHGVKNYDVAPYNYYYYKPQTRNT